MSIAKLRPTAARGRLRNRWALGGVLTAAMVAGAGCDQRNLAVISLEGLSSSATAITAYYRHDGAEWKGLVPLHSLQQIGIELPKGEAATLETQVFSYANRLPCSLGSAAGATDLDGGTIRELTLSVTPTTSHCTAAVEPVDFPAGKMVVWANAANDIWLAGTGGKILHWDGAVYVKVALPAALMATPPDWNAILDDGTEIWFAGTGSAVAIFDKSEGSMSVVPMLKPMPTDWRSIALANPMAGSVVLTGTNRTLGVGVVDPSLGVAPAAFDCGPVTPTGELTAVGCPSNGSLRCFFATSTGGIASLQAAATGTMPICKNVSSPTLNALQDIYVGVNLAAQTYDIRLVGKGGVALRATTPIPGTADPNFMATNTDYSGFLPASARVDLNRVGGTSLDALWIVGRGGVLVRWQNTPAGMPPVMPFVLTPSGLTADLSSVSGFGSDNLFFSGAGHTLGYIGPLFKPN